MAILNTEEYAYIVPPSAQFNDENGKPYAAGFVEFYRHGTNEKYITFADWSGSYNPFRIPLNSQGRTVAIAPKGVILDMYVYNYLGNLAYSRLNVNYVGTNGFAPEGLVRRIDEESSNVHARVVTTLADGTVVYGIAVDKDTWIADAIVPNQWTDDASVEQGSIIWHNEKLYLNLTGENTATPPSSDTVNWKETSISEFLRVLNVTFGGLNSTTLNTNGDLLFNSPFMGNVTVQNNKVLLDKGKLYHVTLHMQFGLSSQSPNDFIAKVTDSEGNDHEFCLIGSKAEQIVEASWDFLASNSWIILTLSLPENVSYTKATLYLHSVNTTIAGGNGGGTSNIEVTSSDHSVSVTESTVGGVKTFDLSVPLDEYARIEDLPEGLPEHDAGDAGKVLKVNAQGEPEWEDAGSVTQVQADWTEADSSAPDYIKNKPQHLVQDANYVHTDNNYTNSDKNKLAGIEAGAEVNVQSDWNQADSSADDYIKNKPSIPTIHKSTYN
jgi:hypothetical protein